MPEPEEPKFACVGCGAMNPVGAEVCQGCGHRFAGTSAGPTSMERSELPPVEFSPPTREERPSSLGEGVWLVVKIVGAIILVLLSSLIAFVATCFPTGLIMLQGEGGGNLAIPLVVGGVAALLAGGSVIYFIERGRRNRSVKARYEGKRP